MLQTKNGLGSKLSRWKGQPVETPSRFEHAARIAEEPMDITIPLGIPGRLRQVGARNARSRAGRQNRLGRGSRVDRAGRIGRIDRVTRARGGDGGRIVGRRTVEAGVTEVSRTTDIEEESNGRHGARRQNQGRLTRNMFRISKCDSILAKSHEEYKSWKYQSFPLSDYWFASWSSD